MSPSCLRPAAFPRRIAEGLGVFQSFPVHLDSHPSEHTGHHLDLRFYAPNCNGTRCPACLLKSAVCRLICCKGSPTSQGAAPTPEPTTSRASCKRARTPEVQAARTLVHTSENGHGTEGARQEGERMSRCLLVTCFTFQALGPHTGSPAHATGFQAVSPRDDRAAVRAPLTSCPLSVTCSHLSSIFHWDVRSFPESTEAFKYSYY